MFWDNSLKQIKLSFEFQEQMEYWKKLLSCIPSTTTVSVGLITITRKEENGLKKNLLKISQIHTAFLLA